MNTEQMHAAQEAMVNWLSHPSELGKPPAMIECVGTFDLQEMHYYLFRFKKGFLGSWLLGVCGGYVGEELEHCGHVFSEMQKYDPKTAVQQATDMVERIRAHWKTVAEQEKAEEEAEQERKEKRGSFLGFVLLSESRWDKHRLIADLKEMWGIDAAESGIEQERKEDTLLFSVGQARIVISLMPTPIPNGEAAENAEKNYGWPDAVRVAETHKAHLVVAALNPKADPLETGKLFVKAMAGCCRQETATGVYTCGTVLQTAFYLDAAEVMKDGELPIYNWVWFGFYQDQKKLSAYTDGMTPFGKDEIEVLETKAKPSDLRGFLFNVVYYVLSQDVTLRDGDTIGFTKWDKHAITRSKGVALPGMTVKVSY